MNKKEIIKELTHLQLLITSEFAEYTDTNTNKLKKVFTKIESIKSKINNDMS